MKHRDEQDVLAPGSYTGLMIEQDVLERVLAGATKTGADFAEVYAEDKRSTSAGLDDGRIEQVTSGRDRGADVLAEDHGDGRHRTDIATPVSVPSR